MLARRRIATTAIVVASLGVVGALGSALYYDYRDNGNDAREACVNRGTAQLQDTGSDPATNDQPDGVSDVEKTIRERCEKSAKAY